MRHAAPAQAPIQPSPVASTKSGAVRRVRLPSAVWRISTWVMRRAALVAAA